MRICVNGVYRDMTPQEEAFYSNIKVSNSVSESDNYADRVVQRLRMFYSIDDELAILRQRDTKPEEFKRYNDLVEQIKAEEKAKEVV